MSNTINAIIACDNEGGIGRKGTLPWPRFSEDMRRFREITQYGVVVMGRNTWDDPAMPKPLPRRINVIITSREDITPEDRGYGEETITASGDAEIILKSIQETHRYRDIYVIGGSSLFQQCMPFIDRVYLTKIEKSFDCDQFIDYNKVRETFSKLVSIETFNAELGGQTVVTKFMELKRPHATIS